MRIKAANTGGEQQHEQDYCQSINRMSEKNDQPLELPNLHHHKREPNGREVDHQTDGMRLPHPSAQCERRNNGHGAQSANDTQERGKDLHCLQVFLVHALIRRRFQEISSAQHVKKEWRVVSRRRDVQWIGSDQFVVRGPGSNCFELRSLGKTRRQHRNKFHVFRQLRNVIDLGIRKWTSRYKNCRDAVLADFRTVLLANNHDVLPRICNADVHQRGCRQRRQPQRLGRLCFVVPARHGENSIRR